MEISLVTHLVCFLFGAGMYRVLNDFLFKKERKNIFTKISIASLDVLERTEKSLSVLKDMKSVRLKQEIEQDSQRESALMLEEFGIEVSMEILSKTIYSAFPKEYKECSLFTTWPEAKRIINKFRELEASRKK